MRARHRALGVGAGAARPCPRVGRRAREYGPLPLRRVGQGRADQLRPPVVVRGQQPASPSEDLAHERSFLSVARLATPWSLHTMCRSLRCALLVAHHTPAGKRPRGGIPGNTSAKGKGNPCGSSTDCVRDGPATASVTSMGVARGWRSMAFVVARISLRLRHGRMGHGRRWIGRPGPSPGSQVAPNHPRPSPSTYPSRPL